MEVYCFDEVKKQIPNDYFEFEVEPIIKLGDETFNHTYAIYGHKLVIKSQYLFNAEVRIE